MLIIPRFLKTALVGFAAVVSLSACIIAPPHPRAILRDLPPPYPPPLPGVSQAPAQNYPGEVMAEVSPPQERYEVVPPLPFLGAIWIRGYWGWYSGRHVWVGGHYVRPVHGHRYVPHGWHSHGRRWVLRGGYWAR